MLQPLKPGEKSSRRTRPTAGMVDTGERGCEREDGDEADGASEGTVATPASACGSHSTRTRGRRRGHRSPHSTSTKPTWGTTATVRALHQTMQLGADITVGNRSTDDTGGDEETSTPPS
jgi:hypothetical protein